MVPGTKQEFGAFLQNVLNQITADTRKARNLPEYWRYNLIMAHANAMKAAGGLTVYATPAALAVDVAEALTEAGFADLKLEFVQASADGALVSWPALLLPV